MMGGFNNLSFYQSPAYLQAAENQNIKPTNQANMNIMNYDAVKTKDQQSPLDLIGKMHSTKLNQDLLNPPPSATTTTAGKILHQRQQNFPYK